jgi:hypothetical protein
MDTIALSSKGMLETWQYKAAKLIFNTNMKHYREVDVICQATFTFSIGNFSVSYIFAKELLKSNHIYIRVKIMF